MQQSFKLPFRSWFYLITIQKTLQPKLRLAAFAVISLLLITVIKLPQDSQAAVNNNINVQGKVTNSDGTNVSDGVYDFVFKLYNGSSSGSTNTFTESWTSGSLFSSTMSSAPSSGDESLTYSSNTNESSIKAGQFLWNTTKGEAVKVVAVNTGTNVITISPTAQTWNTSDTVTNKIYVKDGIFQVALNSLNADANWGTTDFTQDTVTLGINFNSDGEMVPRSQFNTVPYAFRAKSVDGLSVASGKTLTINNSITFSGTDSTTFTLPGSNDTLAGLAASQAFTNKTYNGLTVTSTTGTLTIASGKTLTASSSLTFTGTDGQSFAFPNGSSTVCTQASGCPASIGADSLDFTEFADAMSLDASTSIALGSNTLSTSGAGGISFGHTGNTTFAGSVGIGGAPSYPLSITATAPDAADGRVFDVDGTLSSTTNDQLGFKISPSVSPGSNTSRTYSGGAFSVSGNSTSRLTNAIFRGFDAQSSFSGNSGTLGTAMGGRYKINNTGTAGIITNAYGLQIATPTNTSGTLTNTRGLHIQTQTVGTQTNTPFAIYQEGSSDFNYFAGNVGIGTSTPTSEKLEINGNIKLQAGNYIDIGSGYRLAEASGNFYFYGDNGLKVKNRANSAWAVASAMTFNANAGGATALALSSASSTYGVGFANETGIAFIYSGSTKILMNSSGQLGIGTGITPSAGITLAAGTISANTAPLKFTTGSLLTSPENGAIEFDGTNLYYTSSTTRRTVVNLDSSQALTNKTFNGLTITSSTGTLTITNGKTASISNTLTFTGTDSSSVAFGTGGTVCYTGTCAASSVRLDQVAAANTTATIANGSNAIVWNWGSLTTQTGLTLGGGSAMTSGSVLSLSGTIAQAISSTGQIQQISYTNSSSNNATTAIGLRLIPTISSSTTGPKAIGVAVDAPSTATCNAACSNIGLQVSLKGGTNTGLTQTGLNIIPSNSTTQTVGINIDDNTGSSNEYAIVIGTGWDAALRVNSTTIVNGSGVLQSAGLSGTYSNALTLSSTSNVIAGATFNGLAITNNGSNTLSIAAGKTVTISNSLTFNGTDGNTITFPSGGGTVCITTGTCVASALRLDQLTSATGSNTLNNGANTQTWNWNSLGGSTGIVYDAGSGLTSGMLANFNATFNQSSGNEGRVLRFDYTQASSLAAGAAYAYGVEMYPHLNSTSAGEKNMTSFLIHGLDVQNCTTGNCFYRGLQVVTAGGGSSNLVQYGSSTVGYGITDGLVVGSYFEMNGPDTGTEIAISINDQWDTALMVGGQPILNSTGLLQSYALNGTYSNALTFSSASNSFTGVGTGLTALNASNLGSGAVPSAALSGTYSSALTFSSTSNALTAGTLTLNGFSNNGGVLYTNGSGVVAQTTVGSNGDCFISAGGGAPGWGSCGTGTGVSPDSLDFTDFKDAMALDASTDIALGSFTLSTSGSGSLSFANTGTNKFTGNIGVSSATPTAKFYAKSDGGQFDEQLPGTFGVTNGSPTVTSSGITYAEWLSVGDTIYLGGAAYQILTLGANITLTTNYGGSTNASINGYRTRFLQFVNGAGTTVLSVGGNGKLGIANGGAANPSFSYISDPKTGFYSQGSGNITFVAGSQNILSANLVSGQGRLMIGNGTAPDSMIQINNDGNTSTSGITFGGSSGTYVQIYKSASNTMTLSASTFVLNGLTTNGGVMYTNGSGQVGQTATGSSGQCLKSAGGGSPTWSSCGLDTYKVKTSDENVASGTTLQDDNDLVLAVPGAGTWILNVMLQVTNISSATPDFKAAIKGATGWTCRMTLSGEEPLGAAFPQATTTDCDGTPTAAANTDILTDAGVPYQVRFQGWVTTNGSGNITLQWAANTSGSLTVMAGSFMQAINPSGADLAEMYYTKDASVTPGTVVSIDGSIAAGVKKTERAYDKNVMGVISSKPGLMLGDSSTNNQDRSVLVALSGRVPVKVNNQTGTIHAGDFLTPSSTPGEAMRATKAGLIIGQAITDFEGEHGQVTVFLKASSSLGAPLNESLVALDSVNPPTGDEYSNIALSSLLSQSATNDVNGNSDVLADRIAAGVEVITPKLTTQSLRTDQISSVNGQGITLKLQSGESFKLANVSGTQMIALDEQGNGIFAGSLQAASLNVSNGLTVGGPATFNGQVSFFGSSVYMAMAEFMNKVVFRDDVLFTGRPTFNSDTAGFATIHPGQQDVTVTFDKVYAATPIVNATVTAPQLTDDQFQQLVAANSCSLAAGKQACQDAQDELYANTPVAFTVIKQSQAGFTLRLAQPATGETKFNWTALAVDQAKNVQVTPTP